MTERERDERDLAILREYDAGMSKKALRDTHGVTRHYLDKLLKEACNANRR